MADTTFVDRQTPIYAAWLNDVNNTVYKESINVASFGAIGNGVADDTVALQAALNSILSTGGVVKCNSTSIYRITSGLNISYQGQILDLNGATILADFSTGTAITVGDGTVIKNLGVINGTITTSNTSTSLNGVIFKTNTRRGIEYGGLRISGFKGVGLTFEQLNWSIQAKDAPIIENCGINLDINNNGNAISLEGFGLDGATTYNARLRGTVAVTFVGGYIQNAGTAGILIDTGTVGSLQISVNTTLVGVYFEANGTSHIIGNNGRGFQALGCFINCNGMTGVAIDLNNWTGAYIAGNTPQNTSGRAFVDADATSSGICVGRQNITTVTDVTITGTNSAYVSDSFPVPVSSLPTASLLNRGTQLLLTETGTAANSSRPYLCIDTSSGTRAFRQLALQSRKQGATAGGATLTPDLSSIDTWDLTLPNAGITINAPTGPFKDGDTITFIFKQSGASTGAVTWNAVFKTDLSTTVLNSAYATVQFQYSAGRSLWIQTAKMEWKI